MSQDEPDIPDELPCEACGRPVQTGDGTPGLIINYRSLLTDWGETYAFCDDHKPRGDDLEEVKQRIKDDKDPLPNSTD